MPPFASLTLPKGGSHPLNRASYPLISATILQIVPGIEVTPSALAAISVAGALNAAGGRALVACTDMLKGELHARGGIYLPLPPCGSGLAAMALSIWHLAHLIKQERVDVVHLRSPELGWAAYAAARLTKTPLITSLSSRFASGNPAAMRCNSFLARGDLVLADSSFAAGLAAQHYPHAAGKIRIVPRGIDGRLFSPGAISPARVAELRRSWKIAPHERMVYVSEAAASSAASLDVVVKAAKLLMRSGLENVKFILSMSCRGTARRSREIDHAIGREGMQSLMCRAVCADLPAALLAASVAIAPTPDPRVLGEILLLAQAMGTPAIAANSGAAPEMILAPPAVTDPLRTGFLVRPGDAPALAVAIAHALALGAMARSRLASRAISHVAAGYSMERICAETLRAYIDVWRGGEHEWPATRP
ncbi:MAG: glycosyltransferase [Methylocapsa sp.]|nr:glycosyltransferase [Methylocapsa sp.]